ncbi:MAG: bifunctional 5,10-methylenetetrahydrofolate dehydrogenase/5,10-methenyltetrahydrofolate cyclohydrolase, partial [Pirellulaceae bacterium]|nr:bifunctional 5,10-methylenetetrahydrofolate dehydrogenase/5,10-methenyltetrahydrofolate cyclohydrolase [Pirellulaceae bacterium]
MPATILDGKKISLEIQQELAKEAALFTQESQTIPTLAAILVGNDPASEIYIRNKENACRRTGLNSQIFKLPQETSKDELLTLIDRLNDDKRIHGILVQLPLPKALQKEEPAILDRIAPLKDVDAFHPENVGLLSQGRPRFLPCTPHGVLQILHHYNLETAGKHAVVIGRSDIVGKPMAMLLDQRSTHLGAKNANATVTLCHSRTKDLPEITRQADILIAAIGKANFVNEKMVKPEAIVIDVGI